MEQGVIADVTLFDRNRQSRARANYGPADCDFQASIPFTTCPCTSVRRYRRPWNLKVNCS